MLGRFTALVAGLLGFSASLGAQAPATSATPRSPADVRGQIEAVRQDPSAISLPPADSFSTGARIVAAGTTVPGTVAVTRGDLEVRGIIEGNAIAIGGDVVILPGGHVRGNAFSALGRVRLEGGSVDGEIRALGGGVGPVSAAAARALSPQDATLRALKLAVGWLAVLTMIGIGVLVFAGSHLDGVASALERGFLRSFWTGFAGQLLAAPALLVLCVALAITVIGVLLVPFAMVAFLLAIVGLLTLGFLATAQVTGRSLVHRRARGFSERGSALRALATGIVLFLSFWVLAAAMTWSPAAATALRAVALVVTWVAATAGFGAALQSRAGTRQEAPAAIARPSGVTRALDDSMGWQTPTPVGGVVAARRPTPAPSGYADR